LALNLDSSLTGNIPNSFQSGSAASGPPFVLDPGAFLNLSGAEALRNFDAGNAAAQQDTVTRLELTEDEQTPAARAADLQKAMQAVTQWIRSGARANQLQRPCGGEGQVPCPR
ncbi:MAG: hypothetical protein ACKO0M_00850, partial [Cyanobium sp.]